MIKSAMFNYLNRKRELAAACCAAAVLSFGMQAAQANQSLPTRHMRADVLTHKAALVGHMDPNQTLHLSLILPLRDQAGLEAFLGNLYDENSPNYKHYLGVEEFTRMFSPTQSNYDKVVQFAGNHGLTVTSTSSNRMLIQVDAKVSDIEKAFNLTMNVYKHPTENRTFHAPDREPTVNLSTQLWAIGNLDDYSLPKAMATHSDGVHSNLTGSGPGGQYLAADMRKAYYGTGTLDGTGQSVGVWEFGPINTAGPTLYFNTYQPWSGTQVPESVDGTTPTCTGSCGDEEQALDVEEAVGMAPNLSHVVIYVGSDTSGAAFLNKMISDNSCKTIGCSWQWKPADPTTLDPLFAQFSAQGQTFFTASGDSGKWASGGYNYPADDVNQTAVGGTVLVTSGVSGGETWVSETGWNDSGGGPNIDHIAIPTWQHSKLVVTKANKASKTLRNGPDVAMEANFDNQICYDSTCQGGWAGTSFAAPRWAGYIALANQQAVSHSDPLVGFLNPTLYSLAESSSYSTLFHDQTSGNNGEPCEIGYDLVTGWGSPVAGGALINKLAP